MSYPTPMANPSRRELLQLFGAAVTLIAIGGASNGAAFAKQKKTTRVSWTEVEVPEDKLRRRRERTLRSVLKKESKNANWGDHKDNLVEASVKVVEFQVQQKEHVVRVTCTAVGKLAGGPSVRTHFSIGDHPKRQDKLEKMVLTLVARGIVTRLAAISRDRAARASRKAA